MDYKSVLEKQIEEMQKMQKSLNKDQIIESCSIAKSIMDLIQTIKSL